MKIFILPLLLFYTATFARSPHHDPLDPNRNYKIVVLRCLEENPRYIDLSHLLDCIYTKMGYDISPFQAIVQARNAESPKRGGYPEPYYIHVLHCLNNFPDIETRLQFLGCVNAWKK